MDIGNPDSADDDVWGSWEEMEDSGALDERLEKEFKSHQSMGDAKERQAQVPVVIQDDSMRTSYQPQLKILKRPTEAGVEINGDLDKDSRQTVAKTKSLAEREAAYAEARKRIMGSAKSDYPEEDVRQGMTVVVKPATSETGSQAQTEKLSKGKR